MTERLRRRGAGILILPIVVVGVACQGLPEHGSEHDIEVLATFDGGVITVEDVDRAVLEGSITDRVRPDDDAAGWYEAIIDELVIDRLLLAEAESGAADIESILAGLDREARREAVVAVFLERTLPSREEITEEEVSRYYSDHSELYLRPARREVSHLFLRRTNDTSEEELEQEMLVYRGQILSGVSFARLAAEHSDSESRHRGGQLGWLRADEIDEGLADVLFSLPVGVPSEPIVTPEGVHLFLITTAIEGKRFTVAEVRKGIERTIAFEHREAAVARLTDDLPRPANFFVVDGEELGYLLESGDNQAVVLRIGDFEESLEQLRTRVTRMVDPGGPSPELPQRVLALLERRELIFLHAEGEGLAADPEVIRRVDSARRREVVSVMRQRALLRALEDHGDRVEAFYEANRMRYSSPLRLDVRRLVVPMDPATANATMEALERIRTAPSPSRRAEEMASELGGELEAMGWRTVAQLARLRPLAAELSAGLGPGQASPPFRTLDTMEVVLVDGRQEPQPLPFASVYDRVRNDYLLHNLQEVYREWMTERLEEAGRQVFGERVAALAEDPSQLGTRDGK